MFHRKLIQEQLEEKGVRIGDTCSISPPRGRRRVFTLNRHSIDFVSSEHPPVGGVAHGQVELSHHGAGHFHYRLELDCKTPHVGRFVLKTIDGRPFWINGIAAREAYVERSDRLYLEDCRINFHEAVEEGEEESIEHPMLKLKHLMESDLKILLMGETGTGKTVLAKKVHELSGRRGAFVGVNLSAFSPSLIESELFGHRRGSFTGALQDRRGAFEMAEHGTLFLDEVDSLSLDFQTKLLTFIDGKLYRKVGETSEREIKARLIFASGRSLEGLVEKGVFRKDFYYRLKSGHTADLAALRNDPGRILLACRHFSRENGITFSVRLLDFYQTLPWPGNLRQLFGHLEKKKVLSRTLKIDFDQMDEELLQRSSDLMSLDSSHDPVSMDECKLNHLKKTLGLCSGNVAQTARRLRMTEKSVRNLIQRIS